ncbi:integrase [Mycolicibacterium sp. (ex Dasyatis americana)]|nr:integrase [Mycolicibacterium sp. (ex Dasyatis americana)]
MAQKRTTRSGATTYVARWYSADGREHSKRFRTKKAAEAHETEANYRKQHGVEFDPKRGAVTFRDTASVWLASRVDLKPRTLRGYREMLAPAAERRGDMRHLGIDAVFGGYPVNAITRDEIQQWVNRLSAAGKKPSTVRHAYFVVRQVLRQAVHDHRIPANPADNVKLPSEHSANGGNAGVVDDPAQFLTPTQIAALVDATPWPYNVYVHVAAWSGLRAGELCGLQVSDVDLPDPNLPIANTRPGLLRVERTVIRDGGLLAYDTPKTRASRRRVPLTAETTALLRDYLRLHPQADKPDAPLFPAFRLTAAPATTPPRKRGTEPPHWRVVADRQADTLAALSVPEAEARLVLDWAAPLRHLNFYKAVFRPAVLRAKRLHPNNAPARGFKFHSLRHTYVSLCVAAGIPPLEISRFVGHSKVTTTLNIYAHLFEDDHSGSMAALNGLAVKPAAAAAAANIITIRRG